VDSCASSRTFAPRPGGLAQECGERLDDWLGDVAVAVDDQQLRPGGERSAESPRDVPRIVRRVRADPRGRLERFREILEAIAVLDYDP